ncbi:MAG: 16S rRNA (cytosine(1402)-N(4))-methyltransferase RsmH [Gammaproteobacteria bacterium]|nr:16S rRNA (cytosine(1402)-N(4))-methyltransferase RsmH [Pseudomonadales bacterium]MCP5345556.1 16S rRNA (cytosine(1402)-N(4))-methyltransferase RsmH [Pseudomonadales bacterium]
MNDEFAHRSVLLEQAVDALLVDRSGCYIDATYGRGGHSRLILNRLSANGRLFALDHDPAAVQAAEKLASEDPRVTITRESFVNLAGFADRYQLTGQVSGVLLDLGVSSPQLDDASRGFSFLHDGPLDMRMNPDAGPSAAQWVNSASEKEIATVLHHYGEERFARRMARAIAAARAEQPIERTGRLAEIIKQANPSWERDKHPATRAFQGIRIFINRELDALRQALDDAVQVLRTGGRLVVISFHSLEDKIVKNFMSLQTKGDNFPRDLPVMHSELHPTLKTIGKALRPDAEEISRNPRSRSAIMRVAEKIA